ncbi:SDR family oxidoreductase [Rhizobium halophytocola]|uniref:NAD(P)-dependent dehydrogenase (Short-subunit alcohol dehydrogenase family) n=1 Tax=Rhizobium halophytocola TaxID=735519 RepID=A0ABS4DU41_9HYPH|nr:SDR family oxidoreductase [Rhizobium halophytocola]MBP1849216.1 NAD(P)-dependent dehydrogenase (short-subunit alcohol dehydrogenase family) [Rhizobium halophytocola]
MPNILISGANRGIGLELARQFAAGGWSVIGTARNPDDAEELASLGGNVEVMPLEVDSATSLAALKTRLSGRPIDVLLANAGITGALKASAEEVTRADFLKVQAVNGFAPLALATTLKDNLLAGERRLVTAMSSLMSSVGANDWGTQFTYRASKTALNASWRALSREWAPLGLTCVLLRPGMVATRMTEFKGIRVEDSVAGLKTVVEGLGSKDSGRIIGFDGLDVPW